MSTVAQMLRTSPKDLVRVDRQKLEGCIKGCYECARACTACADACLREKACRELVDSRG